MEAIESELRDAKNTENELFDKKHASERDRLQENAELKRKRDAEDVGWQERLNESYRRMDVCITIGYTDSGTEN